ncbi:MAG: hypothetical protein EOP33_01015 [Rickettsiaceae bacterium]|nr:MAG: hypothetical protein EOP33_01015 [Rickettsiaceae bacterium]
MFKFIIKMSLVLVLSIPAIFASDQNLSYCSSKLNILPLLKLKQPDLLDSNTVIYIHPPKVGGTTLLHAMEAFKELKSKRFSVPRKEGVSPILIIEGWTGGYVNLDTICKNHQDCDNYRLINGHFPYGAHQYINNKYKYIALIRSPLERELSSLNFIYQRGFIKNKNEAREHLLNTTLDNPQVRMLAGSKFMKGKCDDKVFAIAKANIEKDFLLVGVTEDVDHFIQVMLTLLKLQPIATARAQVTANKIYDKLPSDIETILKEKHKYDLVLYQYVKDRWQRWVKENVIGVQDIKDKNHILTILPEYMASHQAVYMSIKDIEKQNNFYRNDDLIKIIQHSKLKKGR